MTFWQPFWILAAILEIKENNFPRNRFLGLENIHLDLFYCFLRHLQGKICKILDFGGHLGKMADRKKCSTFGVWLQNGFGFSSSKPNGNHHKSLYMSQNKVQLPNARIIIASASDERGTGSGTGFGDGARTRTGRERGCHRRTGTASYT